MKRYRVSFGRRAQLQLDNLYSYIAAESGEMRAEGYIGGIVTRCLSLTTFPERGVKRDDIRPLLRVMGYERTATIAFSVDHTNRAVTILGVFYSGQNYESLLIEDQAED